jgi:hypothetical protein
MVSSGDATFGQPVALAPRLRRGQQPRPARSALIPALLLLALALGRPAGGDTPDASEYEVKAAFLYNFAKFVEWPQEALTPGRFTIGIIGEDPFGGLLQQLLNGRLVADRQVDVKRVRTLEEAARVQILFIGGSEEGSLGRILNTVRRRHVLTVGDREEFAARGCVIGFHILDNRVRFAVNLASADEAGLKMSSQLLKLATIVGPPR